MKRKISPMQASLLIAELMIHSGRNWEMVKASQLCGCYYCAQVFPSSGVRAFEENENGERGAVCPYCGRKTLVIPSMIIADAPFTADTMRGIREGICFFNIRHTRLSDMFKKDKWAYEHWHDFVIDFWVEGALKPIKEYIETCVERGILPTEEFSSDALKVLASELAEKYLNHYIAEGTDNQFVPHMKDEIRRTILSKAIKQQEKRKEA